MASSSEHKKRGYRPPCNDEERLLVRRVSQLAMGAVYGGVKKIGFLSDRELELALAAGNASGVAMRAFGGYESAERCVLAFSNCEENLCDEVFEIGCVRIEAGAEAKRLTHRDYLGALMALGLTRETLGDILPDEKGAFVYARRVAVQCILNELTGVGRCTVHCEESVQQPVQQEHRTERTASVASLRLDAVLSAMLRVSRSEAGALIRAGAVSINHVQAARQHEAMYENDVVRVKGYGKYELCAVGAQSKKGRTFITYCQF